MKPFLVLVICSMILTGCVLSRPFTYKRESVSDYLLKNPDVPEHINHALMAGEVVNGMTQTEVILCLGKPTKRESTTEYGAITEKWYYSQPIEKKNGLERSRLWNNEIPQARVRFGDDGRVTDCQIFGTARSSPAKRRESKREPAAQDQTDTTRKQTIGKKPAPSTSSRTDSAQRTDSEAASLDGWPDLLLTGISAGGNNPTAIINNEVVSSGETVDGVKVREITPQGVLLHYQGKVQFLQMQPPVPQ